MGAIGPLIAKVLVLRLSVRICGHLVRRPRNGKLIGPHFAAHPDLPPRAGEGGGVLLDGLDAENVKLELVGVADAPGVTHPLTES